MTWVRVKAVAAGQPRPMWVQTSRIVAVIEPPGPGMPGGIIIDDGGARPSIFDIQTQDEITQLLSDIAAPDPEDK